MLGLEVDGMMSVLVVNEVRMKAFLYQSIVPSVGSSALSLDFCQWQCLRAGVATQAGLAKQTRRVRHLLEMVIVTAISLQSHSLPCHGTRWDRAFVESTTHGMDHTRLTSQVHSRHLRRERLQAGCARTHRCKTRSRHGRTARILHVRPTCGLYNTMLNILEGAESDRLGTRRPWQDRLIPPRSTYRSRLQQATCQLCRFFLGCRY